MAVIIAIMCYTSANTPLSADSGVVSISRQIRYSFTIQNTTGRLVANAGFHTYAPLAETPFQRCRAIRASHPYTESVDAAGNRILAFSLGDIPPYATRTISITADLLMIEHSEKAAANTHLFISPESFVESGHPNIAAMAGSLRGADNMATAQNIFDEVSRYLTYAGYSRRRHGALSAYTRKKGDCTEFMDLFVALCRANTIPARGIGGYICPVNMVLRPQEYHNWAEFYADDTWQLADPQKKVFRKNAADYVAMCIVTSKAPFQRFQVIGDGLTVKMN